MLEQSFSIGGVFRIQCSADCAAAVDVCGAATYGLKRRTQAFIDMSTNGFEAIAIGDVVEQDDEFVTCVARNDVVLTQISRQARGDFLQPPASG